MDNPVSKSTMSKVLRHCGGVDSETRRRILRENPGDGAGVWDVYCILPDLPGAFWKEALRGLMETAPEGVRVKYNVYTKLGDSEAVLTYLGEASRGRARAVIIAAVMDVPVREKLEAMSKNALVILLSEQEALVNGFYVGADAYGDGFRMGQLCAAEFSGYEPLILEAPGGRNIQLRLEGFRAALEQGNPALARRVRSLSVSQEKLVFSKTAAASLAMLLAEVVEPIRDYVLYIPWGMPQLPLAVRKAEKRRGQFVCLCHDAGVRETPGIISCEQDLWTQGKTAMESALRYLREQCFPAEKYQFVPSKVGGF